VRTANLAIVPAAGVEVSIVKGKEDEPVQGWAGSPWHAIPTAIFRKAGQGTVNFCFVLEPLATGAAPRVIGVEQIAGGARIKLADGRSLEAQLAPEPAVKR
jgi:hypothetical protein